MGNFKDFFGSKFGGPGKGQATPPGRGSSPARGPAGDLAAEGVTGAPYKKGDFIGQRYEVHGVLGIGGFGVVYLVYSHQTAEVYALKTFRDEYLADALARERFRREAQVWVDLERHPYLVPAYFVDEVAGRLYIGMEYIAPDEHGLNSLDGYLTRPPPDLAQSLRWAVQFCYGMEYAYSRGVRCHRDIKPANILISQDKTVKVADFGLAGVLGASRAISAINLSVQQGSVGLSCQTVDGAGFGTPTHMPPEQFTDAASCDERSDIYAFGIVLYQMAAGGRLPFLAPLPRGGSREEMARFWWAMHRLHSESPAPRLQSPLFPILERCLEKQAGARYQSFRELRVDLEPLLQRHTGEVAKPPRLAEFGAPQWSNKGVSLHSLGRYDEAIRCYDRALELDPQYAAAWINKGNSLHSLGRYDEAIRCYDRALELDPQYAAASNNKGNSLHSLGRYDEAICCCDRALELDPQDAATWSSKGNSRHRLARYDEAIRCYDRALELDPQDAAAWNNKGLSLHSLGRHEEAIRCCDRALEINPQYAAAWHNRGNSLNSLGWHDEAIRCCDRALELDPQYAAAWYNKGIGLNRLSRYDEAICCYDRALGLDPQDANALYAKALVQEKVGCMGDAASSYQKFISLTLDPDTPLSEYARKRLREMGELDG
ncbi:MAG: serine/threonine-protein kinase [Dehalococcoidia bacterium]|nr:serine/threonine-protein kinase [Dehalococcoidia bacterium]